MFERIRQLISAIRNNWSRILLYFFMVGLFALILFPFDDLGDLVSSQVVRLSNNNLYVSFERMGISLFPRPGIELKQVYVEPRNVTPLSMQEVTMTPSLSGLIHQKPFGSVSANGFLKGQLDIKLGSGKMSDNKVERYQLDVSANKLNLYDIRELVNLPVLMRGQMSLQLENGQLDPALMGMRRAQDDAPLEQPEVDVYLTIDRFEIPSTNLPIYGGLTIPEIKFGKIVLKGRMAGGRINITEGVLGEPTDELYGKVKFNVTLNLQVAKDMNNRDIIRPVMGGYSAELDLVAKKSFEEKVTLLFMLEKYRNPTPEGATYRFKVSAANPYTNPQMEALR